MAAYGAIVKHHPQDAGMWDGNSKGAFSSNLSMLIRFAPKMKTPAGAGVGA